MSTNNLTISHDPITSIEFDLNQQGLSKEHTEFLNNIGILINKNKNVKYLFQIIPSNKEQINLEYKRTDLILEYLKSNFKIKKSQILIQYFESIPHKSMIMFVMEKN